MSDSQQPDKYFDSGRVGIGIPVYNGEEYLEETFRSVLNQTFGDFEIIVSDNASTDRTSEICLDYAKKDPRIHYIRQTVNLGASKNYSACFLPSRHEYFRWSNADDLLEPTLVEKCVQVLDENPNAVLTYCKTKIIDADGNVTSYYDDNLDLPDSSPANRFLSAKKAIGLSNVLYGLMRRELLAQTALLGNYIASDINLILELTLYGKFIEIPDFLFSRRMHESASSWDRSDNEVQREFWDPAKKKLQFQFSRRVFEYYKATLRAPISLSDKARLCFFLARNSYWHKDKLFRELTDYFRFTSNK